MQKSGVSNYEAGSRVESHRAIRRVRLGFCFMVALLVVVAARVVVVQGFDPESFASKAADLRTQASVLPSERGAILDMNGTVLAQSIVRYDIVGAPNVNTSNETFRRLADEGSILEVSRDQGLQELADLLDEPEPAVREQLSGEGLFTYLAKAVDPGLENEIMKLGVPGVESRPVKKRGYPQGAVAGSIVGYTNDSGGAAGLELTLNDRLEGKDGERTYQIGADGIIIPTAPLKVSPATNGQSVKLTIDTDLQYAAQQAIETQVAKLNADWANIIVVEAKTGKVRAMAETGSVDPNNPGATAAADRGARSVQAALEPGSTDKAITAAAAIEEGIISPESRLVIPPGYTVNGQFFKDSFEHGTEHRTFAGVIGSSMNTGTVIVGQELSRQQRYDYLKKFGVGEKTGIPLPGESSGLLAPPDEWDGRQEFAVLFGQGVSQTLLQTTMAFQAIANDGLLLKPQLIESYIDPDGAEHPVQTEPGARAISESTARQTRDILESVVTAGGAKDIKVPGYRVGGKTGTAEAVADDGIGLDGYTASFVGMAPMDDPEYVVMVNVQRPQGNIYGISTAPVFNNIMGRVLTRFNVQPSRAPGISLPQEY
ncbi:penicillin-binding protein 2 [Arthrobacter sp. W4I7]|uniref:peptidoglycan D,D-transpeptidase FtsI family protein n=1 Tax=Arthrobacter sp. W4I7 TaxID=3042296 RepID=UPI00278871AD|nr:penicillin-binding protein 2 [Arthrobacter sp. W4I7]MDQ0690927.1 cell division protein FtsI (penicillin-binding protein 3) [Arthrobacter sp. W4I7]